MSFNLDGHHATAIDMFVSFKTTWERFFYLLNDLHRHASNTFKEPRIKRHKRLRWESEGWMGVLDFAGSLSSRLARELQVAIRFVLGLTMRNRKVSKHAFCHGKQGHMPW